MKWRFRYWMWIPMVILTCVFKWFAHHKRVGLKHMYTKSTHYLLSRLHHLSILRISVFQFAEITFAPKQLRVVHRPRWKKAPNFHNECSFAFNCILICVVTKPYVEVKSLNYILCTKSYNLVTGVIVQLRAQLLSKSWLLIQHYRYRSLLQLTNRSVRHFVDCEYLNNIISKFKQIKKTKVRILFSTNLCN